jgi:Tol biopolymer transport system component
MTSRYDLLDQYIDARNAGRRPEFDTAGDPELARLIEAVDQIDAGANVEWPADDFPVRIAGSLSGGLDSRARPRSFVDKDHAEGLPEIAQMAAGGAAAGNRSAKHGAGWYARQFAGMAVAAIVVALLAGGLASLFGSLGDGDDETQLGATLVEPGDLPGTLLYVEYDGDQTIARIDADGTNQQDLVIRPSLRADVPGFTWSPDGESIAYFDPQSPEQWSPAVIMLVDAEGEAHRQLTSEPVTAAMQLDARMAWSPDGRTLAFVYFDDETERVRIGTVHVPTGDIQTVPPDGGDQVPNDSYPVWSPDGQTLAFSRTGPGEERGILTISYGRPTLQQVVSGDTRATQPDWSPDGRSIVYIGERDGGERAGVNVVDVASGQITELNDHDGWDYLPTWSSRDQIAFMSDFGDGSTDMFVVNPDGTGLRNLTEDYDWRLFEPDWSDDGRYLAFTSANEDLSQWRINVYDIETDELYTVLESDNPLHHVQWRPEHGQLETGQEIEVGDIDINLTEEQIELIQRHVEEFLSEDETPMLRANDDVISSEQFAYQVEAALVVRAAQGGMEDKIQLPPEMRLFQSAMEELTRETGLQNVVLGGLLASTAVQQYAERQGLAATQEQMDEEVDRQRDLYKRMRAQVPEDQPLPQDIIIDVIGEERYWSEYLPLTLRESLTQQNVNQAVLEEAGIERIQSTLESVERDLILAEFGANLVHEAEIEVLDPEALGDAELDVAIEYITETYPAFLRERVEEHPVPESVEDPTMPVDAELPNSDAAVSAAREFAEREGRELGTLRQARLMSVDEYEAEYGELPPDLAGHDVPIWQVTFRTDDGESTFYLNALDGSLISRSETEQATVQSR